ncbi:hypothetical protein [Rubinisphaera margarita]|uniref:hypothetical protein n=1 Tax=Rubinisphaera margarita TaxID=2909586 RepID=UPI001EE8FB06|nr:hypothetical protein [Rubinisphaera margarita]MCG6157145.1 hypothetical protein [Rubinisphaera margarita]
MSEQPADNPTRPGYDPHEERLTSRDWTFLGYLVGLTFVSLIVILIVIASLFRTNPNFNNFPKEAPEPTRVAPVDSP